MEDYKKKYEQGLSYVKDLVAHNVVSKENAGKYFSELCESDDEKIRKELLKYVTNWQDGSYTWNSDREFCKKAISWLEKQKTVETPQWMIDFLDEHRRHFGTPMDHDERKDVDGKLLAIVEWLEGNPNIEQKELKIIPRFRVGDLVRSKVNSLLTYKVLEVGIINELGNPDYKVELFTNGKPDILNIEVSKMDKWGELVEQKPVEVSNDYDRGYRDGVSAEKYNNKWSEEDEKNLAKLASILEIGGNFNLSNWLKSLKPQPKQEWSEEDSKWAEEIRLALRFYSKDKPFVDKLTVWFNNHIQSQPKQEWSKKDEKFINNLCNLLASIAKDGYVGMYYVTDLVEGLKSLKPQPNQEWSDEDKANLDNIIWLCENCERGIENTWIPSQAREIKKLIKSLKPQPTQEWSEEDEENMFDLLEYLERNLNNCIRKDEMISWLKSIKNRNHV